jgi:hypothetical protein
MQHASHMGGCCKHAQFPFYYIDCLGTGRHDLCDEA